MARVEGINGKFCVVDNGVVITAHDSRDRALDYLTTYHAKHGKDYSRKFYTLELTKEELVEWYRGRDMVALEKLEALAEQAIDED
jgi:NOL1/NOP2/fmu family ribosome biogenesis protein